MVTAAVVVDPKTWAPVDDRWQPNPSPSMPQGLSESMQARWHEMSAQVADDQRTRMWHLDGVGWWAAPAPRRWHKCSAQTYAVMDWFTTVHRCACGAISQDGLLWLERNRRRAGKP